MAADDFDPFPPDPNFPYGFWDVEGHPVVVRKTPGGGASCRIIRKDGSEDGFPFGDVMRNGVELTREEFIESFPYAARHAPPHK